MIEILTNFLPNNTCVRPGIIRKNTPLVVIHWTANPGQSALGVKKYFAEDCVKNNISSSTNYVVDAINIIEMAPPNEVTWHCGTNEYWKYTPFAKCLMKKYNVASPNYLSIGVEVCIDDWTGKFNLKTVDNLKYLINDLLTKYSKEIDLDCGIVRHWDITGKDCPKYYIGKNEEWDKIVKILTACKKGA